MTENQSMPEPESMPQTPEVWPAPTGRGYDNPVEPIIEARDQALEDLRTAKAEITKKAEAIERAKIDSMTGMLNRQAYEEDYPKLFERAKPGEFAVVVVDLVNLKRTNDNYGHQVGDTLLGTVAQRLRDTTRPSDKWYRIGGDELVGLLIGVSPEAAEPFSKESRGLIERLRKNAMDGINEAKQAGQLPQELFSGIGAGGAIKYENDSPEDLFRIADAAMEVDKREFYKQAGVERRSSGPVA